MEQIGCRINGGPYESEIVIWSAWLELHEPQRSDRAGNGSYADIACGSVTLVI